MFPITNYIMFKFMYIYEFNNCSAYIKMLTGPTAKSIYLYKRCVLNKFNFFNLQIKCGTFRPLDPD